jgi:UDP-glucuronate decarboxylase
MTNSILSEDLDRIHNGLGEHNLEGAIVLVTGCAGFLGYYLLHYLVRYSKELNIRKVIGLDSFILEKPAWIYELSRQNPGLLAIHTFDIVAGDLNSIKLAKDATHVIHLASIASPSFYRKHPIETLDANVWGLRHLLEFYRESNCIRGILYFSSSEIYGDPAAVDIPTDEEYRGNVSCVGPRACYDEAKRIGETICRLFADVHSLPITVVRPFNNYGPGMRLGDKRLPADFANSTLEGQDIVIHSDGTPTRTFCYVSDAITGYVKALCYGEYDYFNIGIDFPEISVLELAAVYRRVAHDLLNKKVTIIFAKSNDPNYLVDNPSRRCPSIEKARRLLNYKPSVSIDEGVRRYLSFLEIEKTG